MIFCLDRLLSLPEVFHRIERELDSPESSLEEVARLISNDPACRSACCMWQTAPYSAFRAASPR